MAQGLLDRPLSRAMTVKQKTEPTFSNDALFPPRNRLVVARCRPGVELARAADLLARILDHFLPLGDPADGAGDREQHREHGGREAHRLERDTGIEIDVGIELLLDEVVVMERDALELESDIEQRIVLDAHFELERIAL